MSAWSRATAAEHKRVAEDIGAATDFRLTRLEIVIASIIVVAVVATIGIVVSVYVATVSA